MGTRLALSPDATLLEAARLLQDRKLGCLPVTKEDGTLVGILTQSDFVGLAAQLLEGRELSRVSGTYAVSAVSPGTTLREAK